MAVAVARGRSAIELAYRRACHVVFTPAEQGTRAVGIVVDVVRATSSIAQALAAGYERVLCCREIDEANRLRAELDDEAVVGGEREGVVVEASTSAPRRASSPRGRWRGR